MSRRNSTSEESPDVEEERERRVGLNEALFRDINERVKDLNETFATFTGTMDIVCECGVTNCLERIAISPAEYEQIRSDATTFAVVPGHEVPDVEEIVERRGTYDVVRKRVGLPTAVAEQTDPRSD
jgi:hypothetical protein